MNLLEINFHTGTAASSSVLKSQACDFRLFMHRLVIIKFELTHVGAL